jgi:hypothetical protein
VPRKRFQAERNKIRFLISRSKVGERMSDHKRRQESREPWDTLKLSAGITIRAWAELEGEGIEKSG